jgi:hypothetical protein
MSSLELLRAQMAADPAMARVVNALLDRCDQTGALPKQMLLRCRSQAEFDAAVRLLSAAAVKPLQNGLTEARLDLMRAAQGLEGASLESILYEAAGRRPRNIRAERAELARQAAAAATALAEQYSGAAAAFLQQAAAELAGRRGELFLLAQQHGVPRLEGELDGTAQCIFEAEHNERPIRLANFARRVTGSSKGLRPGEGRYERVSDALLRHFPGIASLTEAEAPRDRDARRRLALEVFQIFRNDTPVDVLCYGHLVLEKRGKLLEEVRVHRELGEPARLLLLHLRGARVAELRATRIVSIENETTFNDYVDWLHGGAEDQIVLCSHGQANWAMVRLLRMLAEAAPGLPLYHWGDLDRFGVLILRSLRRRSGLPIEPLWMEADTFRRALPAGLPLPAGEREEIDLLLRQSPDAVGNDLLLAIRDAGCWIEQEAVAESCLQSLAYRVLLTESP